jgi:alkaline phosphatase
MKKSLLIFSLAFLLFQSAFSQKDTQQAQTKKPKNIILLIGDGMGLTQISAGLYSKGRLALERFFKIGFIKTYSSDDLITDSAAGATAFSCGQKTYNGAVGVDDNKVPCTTLLEKLRVQGYSTCLISTCSFTHATPGSFFAHQPSRKMDEAIAADILKSPVDIVVGGGKKYLEQRTDGRNLLDSLKFRQYELLSTTDAFVASTAKRILYFTADEEPKSLLEGREKYLTPVTASALIKLNQNPKGFFVMIEGSQIDWGGHAMNSDYIITEMMEFDDAIEAALNFAEKDGNTLVIVTADHETGGYAITGGNLAEKKVEGKFVHDEHTGTLIPVFAYGPGADEFTGIYENTQIHWKILRLLGLMN